jgi:LacI family transcriptional regulator
MTKAKRPSTMVDVARAAGVSLKTVSRVLNKENYVREETKVAVLDAAAKLDYRLNQAARILRAGQAQIVILLVNNPSRSYLQDVHFGALEKCHELSMQLVLDDCPDGANDLRLLLGRLSPVGLILTPPLCDDKAILALLDEGGFPYVVITPAEPDSAKMSVNMDDVAAAREMTQYLLDLGHRRIGFIRGHPGHGAAEKRYIGYCDALQDYGVEIDQDIVFQGYFDYSTGLECAEFLLDRKNPPTAIFASNDDMAAAAIAAAYRRNIAIPEKLSVVGFDDTAIAAIISPQLTTIRQPISDLAAQAVTLLAEHSTQAITDAPSRQKIFLDHALIKRSSAGAVSGIK